MINAKIAHYEIACMLYHLYLLRSRRELREMGNGS